MKKCIYPILFSILCAFYYGCSDSDDWKDDIYSTSEWIIASEKRMHNISPFPEKHAYYASCYLIKDVDKNTGWYYDDCEIIGFRYEEGYEYRLQVAIMKVDPNLADSSAPIRLLKILFKEKKQSEGLPQEESSL